LFELNVKLFVDDDDAVDKDDYVVNEDVDIDADLFLDEEEEEVEEKEEKKVEKKIEDVYEEYDPKNYKNNKPPKQLIQEYLQKRKYELPKYVLFDESEEFGFRISINLPHLSRDFLNEKYYTERKVAESQAAYYAYQWLLFKDKKEEELKKIESEEKNQTEIQEEKKEEELENKE
jgi:hypothetical protein